MSIINLISTSIYSIKAHKLRVFLTMIGIIIGISSVVTIISVGDGLKAYVNETMEGTNANKYTIYFESENISNTSALIGYFNKNDVSEIERIKGVQKVEESQGNVAGMSISMSEASYFDKKAYLVINSYGDSPLNIKYGRGFNKGEEDKALLVISYATAEGLFDDPENAVGKGIEVSGNTYEVIGVLDELKGFALFDYSYMSDNNKNSISKSDEIYLLDVFIEPGEEITPIFDEIKNKLKINHPTLEGEYKMQDPQEITKAYEGIIGGLTAFITCITGISLFVGGIGVMNIMYVSVTERKREIGIRRAIGAKPFSVLLQFLFEAIIVTGIGGIIGIILGIVFSKIVGAFIPFKPVVTVASFMGATVTSVIVGVIFGIVPAYNASKLDPIKAIYQ